MHSGMVDIGSGVPITMLTPAEFLTALSQFTTEDCGFNAARSARLSASEAFQKTMDTLYIWLLAARKVLAVNLGEQWSTAWAQAGFINNSTAIPAKIEDRLGLGLNLSAFLTANPSFEAPTLDVTAAQATSLRAAALAAQRVMIDATQTLKTANQTWTDSYDVLVNLMRTLIKNLQAKLGKDDPRWLAFGLPMPGTSSTPAQPTNVVVQRDETGAYFVQCSPVALATRYRARTRISGMEVDYKLAGSAKEPMISLPNILGDMAVEVIVQAVNGALQGVASEPVVYNLPIPQKKEPDVTTPMAAPQRHGNGSSNGHGNTTSNGHANGNGSLNHRRAA